MDLQELELKRMMERREPSSDFTARVMEQVRRESTDEKREQKVVAFKPRSQRYWRWAAVGAIAASLTVGFVVEQRKSNRRQAEAAEAQLAEAQLYETLLLVGQKMNQARTEIRGTRPEGVVQ